MGRGDQQDNNNNKQQQVAATPHRAQQQQQEARGGGGKDEEKQGVCPINGVRHSKASKSLKTHAMCLQTQCQWTMQCWSDQSLRPGARRDRGYIAPSQRIIARKAGFLFCCVQLGLSLCAASSRSIICMPQGCNTTSKYEHRSTNDR